MPLVKRNLRSLRDIKTLSGSADQAALPHRAYMKLACLEMERERRVLERKNAVSRLQNIDARVQAIETEEAAIRRAMGGAANASGDAAPGSGAEPGQPRGKKRQFRVKY